MGVSQNQGYLFGGPYNKDYSMLGSILGYPNCGKLPYCCQAIKQKPFDVSKTLELTANPSDNAKENGNYYHGLYRCT